MRPGFRVSRRRSRGWIAKVNTVSALILLLFVADVPAGSAQVIKGRLLDAQTGQPVPGASSCCSTMGVARGGFEFRAAAAFIAAAGRWFAGARDIRSERRLRGVRWRVGGGA